MRKPRKRFYVGLGGTYLKVRQVFSSDSLPTTSTHGFIHAGVIGPFHTKAGAKFMAEHGANNPHCQTVAQAERLAKKYAVDKA